jgi:hypothetical protein
VRDGEREAGRARAAWSERGDCAARVSLSGRGSTSQRESEVMALESVGMPLASTPLAPKCRRVNRKRA